MKAALKDHKRFHTGEKSYDCVICNEAFSTNGALRMHKMIHDEHRRQDVEDYDKIFSMIRICADIRKLTMTFCLKKLWKVC